MPSSPGSLINVPDYLRDLDIWAENKMDHVKPKSFDNPFDSPDSRAGVGERRCTECKEVFPFDDEHFSKTKQGNLRKVCIDCCQLPPRLKPGACP